MHLHQELAAALLLLLCRDDAVSPPSPWALGRPPPRIRRAKLRDDRAAAARKKREEEDAEEDRIEEMERARVKVGGWLGGGGLRPTVLRPRGRRAGGTVLQLTQCYGGAGALAAARIEEGERARIKVGGAVARRSGSHHTRGGGQAWARAYGLRPH